MLIFSANFVGSKFIQDRATIANEQLRAKAIQGTLCNEVKAFLEEHHWGLKDVHAIVLDSF